jgi:uracil-DNA glycosylase family 4
VAACGPWLVAELDMVQPQGVVLLGATAAQSVYGSDFRITESRGVRLDWPDEIRGSSVVQPPDWALATMHPSAVLRSRQREDDLARLVEDLERAAGLLIP